MSDSNIHIGGKAVDSVPVSSGSGAYPRERERLVVEIAGEQAGSLTMSAESVTLEAEENTTIFDAEPILDGRKTVFRVDDDADTGIYINFDADADDTHFLMRPGDMFEENTVQEIRGIPAGSSAVIVRKIRGVAP